MWPGLLTHALPGAVPRGAPGRRLPVASAPARLGLGQLGCRLVRLRCLRAARGGRPFCPPQKRLQRPLDLAPATALVLPCGLLAVTGPDAKAALHTLALQRCEGRLGGALLLRGPWMVCVPAAAGQRVVPGRRGGRTAPRGRRVVPRPGDVALYPSFTPSFEGFCKIPSPALREELHPEDLQELGRRSWLGTVSDMGAPMRPLHH